MNRHLSIIPIRAAGADPARHMTVNRVVDAYLTHTTREQSARCFENRKRILERFAQDHGNIPLATAKPYLLRFWVDSNDKWKSDWTKRGVCATVQRCFNWGVKVGLAERNPFSGITHPEGDPGRPMTNQEFNAALRGSSACFRRVLFFLYYTGCRPCEMTALVPEMIDFERGLAVLKHHKTARKTKKPRVIFLHPTALKLVGYLIRNRFPDQERIFVNHRGTPWTRYSLACRMKRLRAEIGLPKDCKAYGLRHKYCTDAIKRKIDITIVAKLAGHTSIRTTQRYVHIDNEFELLGQAVRDIHQPRKEVNIRKPS